MKFLALLIVLLSVPAFADNTNECRDQFATYCECSEVWGSYSVELVILNLNTNVETRKTLGKSYFSGLYAKVFCEKEMARYSICK
ncbi:hypothetical protein SHI21_18390 [Bacteriovorax sp. PP10]|uniref:Uncharacterized protein n=1 Tax=Bacteriovorax antarcticus TaxID=3088717 RepID=A0ABU5VYR0_9BACT|nr:hypothetical protein [Bacteriovorax sp. PP10]MEA9358210.1 hypothetical protein [Bacteriovorax sp. PP10]